MLLLTFAACGGETVLPPDSDGLEVGYAEVSVPWRVGAKPGQVGTNALRARDQLLLRALGELLPILNPPVLDPAEHIQGATEWVLATLADRVEDTAAGRYATLFEAGIGLEEPPVMKALVLRRGDTKIAIVRADLYVGHEQLHRRVAALVEAETGIDRDHILFVATHNHSVPHAVSPSPGVWILADAFDPRHFVYVTRAIARAVIDADRARRPASLRTAVIPFREVQHNIIGPNTIRVTNPSGVEEMVPVGYPYNHFDPDLAALRFDDPDHGQPLAFLFVFGMHPESLPGGHGISSGEWPTHVENKLRERTGAPAIWLPGALGDSEPDRGFNHPEHRFMRSSFAAMEVMSEIIAAAAQRAFATAGTAPATTRPRVDQVVADLPGVDGFPLPTSAYLGPRFPMVRILHDSATVRLHAVRLGDVLLLASPAEVTTDLSFNIKSRVDRIGSNVYQGYEWPEAPEWVKQRVRRNFSNDEVDPQHGAPIPVVISHANGYMGYIVSAWEYENRAHYRQEMTAFGAGTADHVASAFVGLVREMEGGPPFAPPLPAWRDIDLDGVDRIQRFLAGLDDQIVRLSRDLPVSDSGRVGTVTAQPPATVMEGETVRFSWIGGTNDMDPPKIWIERRTDSAASAVATGPSRDVVLYFSPPDLWTAEWKRATGPGQTMRFRVAGTYRGSTSGTSAPDPIWDPEGRNVTYETTSKDLSVLAADHPFQADPTSGSPRTETLR
jgi:hypothetical protein